MTQNNHINTPWVPYWQLRSMACITPEGKTGGTPAAEEYWTDHLAMSLVLPTSNVELDLNPAACLLSWTISRLSSQSLRTRGRRLWYPRWRVMLSIRYALKTPGTIVRRHVNFPVVSEIEYPIRMSPSIIHVALAWVALPMLSLTDQMTDYSWY